MSRHRNIRQLDYNEEYDDYYDETGRSVDDDSYLSPSSVEREFMYDRSQASRCVSSFVKTTASVGAEKHSQTPHSAAPCADIGDAPPVGGRRRSGESAIPSHVRGAQLQRLTVCLDRLRDVMGDTVSDDVMVDVILDSNCDVERALDSLLARSAHSALPDCTQSTADEDMIDGNLCSSISRPPLPTQHSPDHLQLGCEHVSTRTPVTADVAAMSGDVVLSTVKSQLNARRLKHPTAASAVNSEENTGDAGATSRALLSTPQRSATPAKRRDVVALYDQHRAACKPHISLVVAGHVDAGKSTLMGHLLLQLGYVSGRQMHKFETDSRKMGKQSFKYAWLLDQTDEERSRGVTMDVGQFRFETSNRSITLLDAPGHKDFIPNMITGACVADAAILVVNASQGEFETGFELGGQTREHAILLRSLGVSQLVVAVNKLDTVAWSRQRYDSIGAQLSVFLKTAGFRSADVRLVPCSGLTGHNLTTRMSTQSSSCTSSDDIADNASWYSGASLVEAIDQFACGDRSYLEMPARACVLDVFRGGGGGGAGTGGGTCVSCRVDSGVVAAGDRLILLPAAETLTVKSVIVDNGGAPTEPMAFAGELATLTLQCGDALQQQLSVGAVLCDLTRPVHVTSCVLARLVVFDIDLPITIGYQVEVHLQCVCVPGCVTRLLRQLQRGSGRVLRRRPRCLPANCGADVQLTTGRPLCVLPYGEFRPYGRLLLRAAGRTVAAGLVTQIK